MAEHRRTQPAAAPAAGKDQKNVVMSDGALVDALRAGRPEAVDEFIARFEPIVWRYAALLRIPVDERSHWVGELLYDVAMTLRPRFLDALIDLMTWSVAHAVRALGLPLTAAAANASNSSS